MPGGRSLGEAVVKFVADTREFVSGLQKAEGRIDRYANRLRRTGQGIESFGKKGLVAGTAIASGLGFGIKKATDFDHAFREVQTLLGNLTDNEMNDLREGIIEQAQLFGQTLPQQAAAAYQAISAGVPRDNLLTFLETAGKAAIGGLTDTATSVDVLTTVVNSYGEQLADLGDVTDRASFVSDVLFQTVKAGKTTFEELATSMGQVAATAANGNVTFEELGAAFATATAKGLSTAEAATAINQAILNFINPTKDAADNMKEMGVEFEKFQKGQLTFAQLMEQVAEATNGSTTEMTKIVPNVRALKAVLLLASEDAARFSQEVKNMQNSAGAADEAFQTMRDSVQNQLARAWSTFEAIMVRMGDAIMPMFLERLGAIQEALNEWAEWIKNNPEEFAQQLERVATWAERLLVFGAVTFAIGKTVRVAGDLVLAFKALVKVGNVLIGLRLASVIGSITIAMTSLKAAMLFLFANPAGVALLATAAAAGVLIGTYIELRKAQETYRQSKIDLKDTISRTIEVMKEEGRLTDEQIKKIEAIEDAEKQHDALREELNKNDINRNIELQKSVQKELEAELGRKATRMEIAHATDRAIQLERDARAGALAFLLDVKDQEIQAFHDASEEQRIMFKKELEHRKQVDEQRAMSAAMRRSVVQSALDDMGLEIATEKELAEAKTLAAKNDITLMEAVLAIRKGFTQEQIDLIGRLTMAEIEAQQQRSLTRKQDTEDLAAQLSEQSATLQEFREKNTERIKALAEERQRIVDEIRAIDEQLRAEEVENETELATRRSQLSEQYIQNQRAMGEAKKFRREISVAAENEIAAKEAEVLGLSSAVTKARLDQGEAQKIALEELRLKHADYITSVITSSQKSAETFEGASAKTQTEVQNMIAMWAESGTSVQKAAERWQQSYQALPPSNGAQNLLDQARQDFGSITTAASQTASEIGTSMNEVHDHYMKLAPSTPGSPAPLDVAREDLNSLETRLDEVAVNTESAMARMAQAWWNFVQEQSAAAQNVKNNMAMADPTARFSPSLVDNVQTGTGLMLRTWEDFKNETRAIMVDARQAMKKLDPQHRESPSLLDLVREGNKKITDADRAMLQRKLSIFKKMFSEELALIRDFEAKGGSLRFQQERGPTGTLRSVDLRNAPKDLDQSQFLAMLRRLEQMFGDTGGLGKILGIINAQERQTREQAQRMRDESARRRAAAQAPPENTGARAPRPVNVAGGQALGTPDLGNRNRSSVEDAIRSGNIPPDVVPQTQETSNLIDASPVTINVESVRDENDIRRIAEMVVVEQNRQRWRLRR